MNQPVFWMMVGLPGSGKSTYVEKCLKTLKEDPIVASSDAFLDKIAELEGFNYNRAFHLFMDQAQKYCDARVNDAKVARKSYVLDQTNLTPKSRARKLGFVPSDYYKIAVVVECPMETVRKRLANRIGKTIPENVFKQMAESYREPKPEEGFDEVQYVNQGWWPARIERKESWEPEQTSTWEMVRALSG